ncbi:MAG TPA: hypothetical protein VM324_11635 [Egibacteraceae bacterium]|nr:hypothetical protein [Egibacteraceae bacterium]
MTEATGLPRPALRVCYALLALALSAGWLVAAALPARAAVSWGVESPVPGENVQGSFSVTAFVESFQTDRPQAVRVRLRHRDQSEGDVRNLQMQGESDTGRPGVRRSTWTGPAFNVESYRNGTYVVEASVVSSLYPDGSPWQGHDVVVDSPPTAKIETVRVSDAARRKVEVRWLRSSGPAEDHVRYVVQRATGGGEFADVHSAVPVGALSHIDTVPAYGDFRYRVKSVRTAADGSEREVVSEPRGVTVKEDASGRPENEGGTIDGPLGGSGENPEGTAPPPSPSGNTSAPRLSLSPGSGGGASGGGRTSGRAQVPTVSPPNANSTFEETLDYGVPVPQWEEEQIADGGGFDDEGTLTVFGGRELSSEQVLPPIAAGLVLTLGGLHIRRFLNA